MAPTLQQEPKPTPNCPTIIAPIRHQHRDQPSTLNVVGACRDHKPELMRKASRRQGKSQGTDSYGLGDKPELTVLLPVFGQGPWHHASSRATKITTP